MTLHTSPSSRPQFQRFAAKDHMTQRKVCPRVGCSPIRLHQLIECRRRLVENGDALARNQAQEFRR